MNAALDEAALHAEQIARWMAAARAHTLQRIPAEERKRAAELYHSLAVRGAAAGVELQPLARHGPYHMNS